MSAGGCQTVDWQFDTSGVGISYTDALSYPYTVRMSNRGSCLTEGLCIPEWPHGELLPLSKLEGKGAVKPNAPWGLRSEGGVNS